MKAIALIVRCHPREVPSKVEKLIADTETLRIKKKELEEKLDGKKN